MPGMPLFGDTQAVDPVAYPLQLLQDPAAAVLPEPSSPVGCHHQLRQSRRLKDDVDVGIPTLPPALAQPP